MGLEIQRESLQLSIKIPVVYVVDGGEGLCSYLSNRVRMIRCNLTANNTRGCVQLNPSTRDRHILYSFEYNTNPIACWRLVIVKVGPDQRVKSHVHHTRFIMWLTCTHFHHHDTTTYPHIVTEVVHSQSTHAPYLYTPRCTCLHCLSCACKASRASAWKKTHVLD